MADVLTGESLALSQWLANPTEEIVAHLAKSPIADGQTITALSELVEADFAGYAPIRIVNPDVFQTEDEFVGEAVSNPLVFVAGDALAAPQNVTAVYVTIKRGTEDVKLWRVFPLLGGFTFDLPGRSLSFALRFNSLTAGTPPT